MKLSLKKRKLILPEYIWAPSPIGLVCVEEIADPNDWRLVLVRKGNPNKYKKFFNSEGDCWRVCAAEEVSSLIFYGVEFSPRN
jgi:hypothetical protein